MGSGTISEYLGRAARVGVGWPLPAELDDACLEARLFPAPTAGHERALPEVVAILRLAAEAIDRSEEARTILAAEGIVVRSGDAVKAHPAVAIERDARLAVARLIRELDLDVEAPAERARPPGLRSNRRGV